MREEAADDVSFLWNGGCWAAAQKPLNNPGSSTSAQAQRSSGRHARAPCSVPSARDAHAGSSHHRLAMVRRRLGHDKSEVGGGGAPDERCLNSPWQQQDRSSGKQVFFARFAAALYHTHPGPRAHAERAPASVARPHGTRCHAELVVSGTSSLRSQVM